MKSLKTLVLTSLLALLASLLAPKARADVNFSFFYDSLSPYGDWVETDDYGYVWQPRDHDSDWRPYSDGYWAQTDAGWTWVSYEDYGGVVYHYGRWVDLDETGWAWVPGYDWGPGWVSWRSSDDYVGWAPLPPRAQFSVSIGFGGAVDRDYDIGPGYYNFCEVRNFGAPDLRPVIVNREQNVTIVNQTTNITNITVNKNTNVVYNGGPNTAFINQRSARPIQRLNLVRQTDVTAGGKGGLRARTQGNNLIMPAPKITRGGEAKLAPTNVAKRLGKTQVNHGWRNVPDAQRQQIQQKFQADAVRPRDKRDNASQEAAVKPASAGRAPIGTAPGEKRQNRGEKADRQAERQQKKNGNLQPFLPADQSAAAVPAEIPERAAKQGKKGKGDAADAAARQERQAQKAQQAAQQQQEQDQARAARKAQRQQEAAAEQQRAVNRPDRQDRPDRPQGEARKAGRADAQENAARAARQEQAAQAQRQAQRQQQAGREQQQRQAQKAQAQRQGNGGGGGGGGGKGKGDDRKEGKKKKDKDNQD